MGTQYFYDCKCDCGVYSIIHRRQLIRDRKSCRSCMYTCVSRKSAWKGYGEISGCFWAHIKNNANQRGVHFDVTIQELWDLFILQDRRCSLTGWDLEIKYAIGNINNRTASLDRIDSKKGYEAGNVQWVHTDINMSKSALSMSDFIQICEEVAAYRGHTNNKQEGAKSIKHRNKQ